MRSEQERRLNIDNFDSGPGVEDILREEVRAILPRRYEVTAGVVSDHNGMTGGDYDIVVFNDTWFPSIKAGATRESRRLHYPIEGVYALLEVKQSLSNRVLDDAMKKLVIAHRLNRPLATSARIVENRQNQSDCVHEITNPLYSGIIAVGLADGANFLSLVERFCRINRDLKRLEVVRSLCVLGHGVVTWAARSDNNGELRPARFMGDDLYKELTPALSGTEDGQSPLYAFVTDLLAHVQSSILAPEDVALFYGDTSHNRIKSPSDGQLNLPVDPEWNNSLLDVGHGD